MRAWLQKHFPRIDLAFVADATTVAGVVIGLLGWAGLMTWAGSSISWIATQGWGAVFFAGIGITCLLAFAARALWPIFLYFGPGRSTSLSPETTPSDSAGEQPPQRPLPDYSDKFRQLDRTAFLVSNAVIERIYHRRLMECLNGYPGEENNLSSNEAMNATTARYRGYINKIARSLGGSFWGEELHRIIKTAKEQADRELLTSATPEGLHPQQYRLFYVAYKQCSSVKTFLKDATTRAVEYDQQTLQNVVERLQHHK